MSPLCPERAQQMLRGNLAWTRYGAGDTAHNWSYTVTWDSAGRDEAAPRRGKNNRVVCVSVCVSVMWTSERKRKQIKGACVWVKKKKRERKRLTSVRREFPKFSKRVAYSALHSQLPKPQHLHSLTALQEAQICVRVCWFMSNGGNVCISLTYRCWCKGGF